MGLSRIKGLGEMGGHLRGTVMLARADRNAEASEPPVSIAKYRQRTIVGGRNIIPLHAVQQYTVSARSIRGHDDCAAIGTGTSTRELTIKAGFRNAANETVQRCIMPDDRLDLKVISQEFHSSAC